MRVLLLLLCFPFIVKAQTNTFPSSGNVGIGTTSPAAKFHINGGQILETTGSSSNSRTLTLMNAGTSQLNLGYYYGAWRSTIQIQNNNATKALFFAPPETDYNYSILRSVNGGIKFDVGGTTTDVGVNAFTIEANGDLQFNSSGWFSRSNNGTSSVALALGQNLSYDYPVVQVFTCDNGGSNFSNWVGSRYGHVVTFERNSSIGRKKMVDLGGHDGQHYFQLYSIDGNTPKITLVADGTSIIQNNLAIGTSNTQGYKLAVNGDGIFNKVKVKQYPWADYVFNSDYKLPTLKEVEEFIKKYKHLPDVPSAKEVEKNGLDLGDNQAKLLKKIEELTLYIIEQDKKIEKMETQNKQLSDIKKELEIIKRKIRN